MAFALFKVVRPQTPTEKKTRTVVDTIMVTPESLNKWKSPPFQRPIRQNEKVRALAYELKHDGGVWPGIVSLGVLDSVVYVIDGQHRKEAFLMSGLTEGYTDVRTHYFQSMADMGEEFVRLNSQLVHMKPDDILRVLEASIDGLKKIRLMCPFVGYSHLRVNTASPLLGMSVTLRSWRSSMNDIPGNSAGRSAAMIAQEIDMSEYDHLIEFLNLALAAFGRDPQYSRLWSALNLMITMWLYRRLVLSPDDKHGKILPVTRDQFKRCLMSVSATTDYVDWLLGRSVGERDRSPCYNRLKSIFAARLSADTGKKVSLPQPAWSR